jgi:PPOX class probable F420-dependent enzyme
MRFADAKYVTLTTYRKSGVGVPTPLWFAYDGDAIVVWTPTGSGKVKRLRNRSDVTVAPCTFRGEPTGEAVAGTAEICDLAGSDRARDLIKRRYGVYGWLTMTGSLLRRGRTGTVGIRIELAAG